MTDMEQLTPDYLQNWKSRLVTYDDAEDDDAEVCVWYIDDDERQIPIIARNELLVITGLQKSRKSLLAQAILMSNYVTDKDTTFGFSLDIGKQGLIYHFDTEQSKRWVKRNKRRFYQACGMKDDDPRYQTFYLKGLSHFQMMEFITHRITEAEKKPDVILIDQIADLMPARDVNDQEGANVVLEHLTKWQELTNGFIMCTIHTNRGGQNTNGKLGVILDQKTECTFLVEFDKNSLISTVTHKDARDRRIDSFSFTQDSIGHPRLVHQRPSLSRL